MDKTTKQRAAAWSQESRSDHLNFPTENSSGFSSCLWALGHQLVTHIENGTQAGGKLALHDKN